MLLVGSAMDVKCSSAVAVIDLTKLVFIILLKQYMHQTFNLYLLLIKSQNISCIH